MVDLSVVIPIYNGEALLRRCLDSLVRQKSRYSWEVWLVDDGSTDGTKACWERFLQEMEAEGRKMASFHLLEQQNAGPAKARNWGMQESQGRYIALLDADDYIEDTYVEKTVGFLESHPECVAVSVVCKNVAVSGVSYTPAYYAQQEGVEQPPVVIRDFYAYWAEHCHVGTCSTTLRGDVARQTGMREDLRISEDYEFWWMMASHGQWGLILEPLYVSDGARTLVTQADWIARMKRRWDNAPALSDWESRIVTCHPELREQEGYRRAQGLVSRNLTYCQLLSGREILAREEARRYGAYFPLDGIGRLMNLCKHLSWTWHLLCSMLRYREYHRFS